MKMWIQKNKKVDFKEAPKQEEEDEFFAEESDEQYLPPPTPSPKPRPRPIPPQQQETRQEEGKLTEQEIYDLGMQHIARGYKLLALIQG